jgi:sorbitol/mannitol transport system substrate-binding protein
MTRTKQRRLGMAGVGLSCALAVSGCAGFGNLANEPGVTTITLASVNNPQMQDMSQLLGEFYKIHPEIKINLIMMEENDLRNAATKDVATKGGQYDVMTVGAYEVPIWGENKWLTDLTDLAAQDPSYAVDDFFKPVRDGVSFDNRLYAVPFYGESSFLMYRKDLFEQAGLKMPERPTWQQVADFAKQLKDPSKDRAGICLRAKPGWGEMFAPLTTVVNTFGGQWYNENWDAQVNAPGFTKAVQFYLDTLKDAGEGDPASFGFTECLNLFSQDRAAMWYDATSAAGSVESKNSKVAGKVGYVRAPVVETKDSGWLWSWNLGINAESEHPKEAWEFLKWATSKDYAKLVGSQLGWSQVPPGTRKSTYQIPEYKKAGGDFAPLTAEIMNEVNPKQPGVASQPWVGIQYVTIPEFQDVGNQTSQAVVDAISGRITLADALDKGQKLAERAGKNQKEG